MSQILIIEDDDLQREVFKDILEHAGYEVFEAPDGEIGVQQYRRQRCDLVITDIYMPEKDGLETILELKQHFLMLPIIAVSGEEERSFQVGSFGAKFVLTAAKRLGADRTLQKPVGGQELLVVVEELL